MCLYQIESIFFLSPYLINKKTGSELIREKMGASSLEIEKVLLICGEKLTQECPLLAAEAGCVGLNWVS